MNKTKFFSSLLVGAMFLASASVVTSCKDYDGDINDLRKTVDQLNTLVTTGSTVTDVTTNANGIVIKLSNGKEYTVSNGTSADVWKIGTDGYWYKNDQKTEYYALGTKGEKGEKGDNGSDGANGANGANGADGIYYVPNSETGCFDIYNGDGTFKEATTISWRATGAGALTAVLDGDNLTLYGVEGAEGGTVVIPRDNALRGLVFEKDAIGRVYVDGVPGIRVASFAFSTLSTNAKNTQAESWVANGAGVINPATYAYYHVNPANAKKEDLEKFDYNYVVKANADYYATRANASNGFDVKGSFAGFEDGVLKVKVDVTGSAATGDKISVAALQVTKDNDETVTSDYACIYNYNMDALRFYNKKENVSATVNHKYHFRRMMIDNVSKYDAGYLPARLANAPVWSTQDLSDYDITLAYNDATGKDLDDIVGVHVFDETATPANCLGSDADLENLNLHVEYEVVKNYLIGVNNTDQADFITLDADNVIKARTYAAGQGTSAIGKTPVIRVSLKDASNKVIEVAYVKVSIVDVTEDIEIINDFVPLKFTQGASFACGTIEDLETKVEDINVQLYNKLQSRGITREYFMQHYAVDLSSLPAGSQIYRKTNNDPYYNNIGVVSEVKDDQGQLQGSTHKIIWQISAAELWNNAGQTIWHYIKYVDNSTASTLIVGLNVDVANIQKIYDINEAKYIGEYWNADKTVAYFNVDVPTSTSDNNPNNCLFENDTNSPFVTYPKGDALGRDGILKVDDYVTSIKYTFHSKNQGTRTIGGENYTFSVSANGETLYGPANEVIATIDNSGTYLNTTSTQLPNVVKLNKNSDLAKKLLNTEEFQIFIQATGYICNLTNQSVSITFKGEEYYTAQYVKPIYFDKEADKEFIDGVDLGEAGSYINIKNIVRPIDWRGRSFSSYANYWNYYGPFTVNFTNTVETAKIKLNGEWQAIPATVDVNYAAPGTYGGNSEYGYITYKNNGTTLNQPTEMQVRVEVNYGWGKILTPWITVKVNTISHQ